MPFSKKYNSTHAPDKLREQETIILDNSSFKNRAILALKRNVRLPSSIKTEKDDKYEQSSNMEKTLPNSVEKNSSWKLFKNSFKKQKKSIEEKEIDLENQKNKRKQDENHDCTHALDVSVMKARAVLGANRKKKESSTSVLKHIISNDASFLSQDVIDISKNHVSNQNNNILTETSSDLNRGNILVKDSLECENTKTDSTIKLTNESDTDKKEPVHKKIENSKKYLENEIKPIKQNNTVANYSSKSTKTQDLNIRLDLNPVVINNISKNEKEEVSSEIIDLKQTSFIINEPNQETLLEETTQKISNDKSKSPIRKVSNVKKTHVTTSTTTSKEIEKIKTDKSTSVSPNLKRKSSNVDAVKKDVINSVETNLNDFRTYTDRSCSNSLNDDANTIKTEKNEHSITMKSTEHSKAEPKITNKVVKNINSTAQSTLAPTTKNITKKVANNIAPPKLNRESKAESKTATSSLILLTDNNLSKTDADTKIKINKEEASSIISFSAIHDDLRCTKTEKMEESSKIDNTKSSIAIIFDKSADPVINKTKKTVTVVKKIIRKPSNVENLNISHAGATKILVVKEPEINVLATTETNEHIKPTKKIIKIQSQIKKPIKTDEKSSDLKEYEVVPISQADNCTEIFPLRSNSLAVATEQTLNPTKTKKVLVNKSHSVLINEKSKTQTNNELISTSAALTTLIKTNKDTNKLAEKEQNSQLNIHEKTPIETKKSEENTNDSIELGAKENMKKKTININESTITATTMETKIENSYISKENAVNHIKLREDTTADSTITLEKKMGIKVKKTNSAVTSAIKTEKKSTSSSKISVSNSFIESTSTEAQEKEIIKFAKNENILEERPHNNMKTNENKTSKICENKDIEQSNNPSLKVANNDKKMTDFEQEKTSNNEKENIQKIEKRHSSNNNTEPEEENNQKLKKNSELPFLKNLSTSDKTAINEFEDIQVNKNTSETVSSQLFPETSKKSRIPFYRTKCIKKKANLL